MDLQPPPPKRPKTAFLEYKDLVYAETKKKNPDMMHKHVISKIGQM